MAYSLSSPTMGKEKIGVRKCPRKAHPFGFTRRRGHVFCCVFRAATRKLPRGTRAYGLQFTLRDQRGNVKECILIHGYWHYPLRHAWGVREMMMQTSKATHARMHALLPAAISQNTILSGRVRTIDACLGIPVVCFGTEARTVDVDSVLLSPQQNLCKSYCGV